MAHKFESIVFIDAGIETPAQLAAGVAVDAKVLILSPDEDGVAQITQAIAAHPDISEIYIVAHGSPGEIRLGNTQLGLKTLPIYSDFLSQWAVAKQLNNLYLYGCNVAAGDAGAEFLAKLRSLTQTNIAASTQIVGAANQGGTWELDTAIGAVPHRDLLTAGAIASYPSTLADPNDFIANAVEFTGEQTLAGNNFGATSEPGEPLHDPTLSGLSLNAQQSANDSLWWSWQATGTGTVNVNTSGSAIDTVLAVYSGPPNATVNDLFLVARNDNAAAGVTSSSITFNATANTWYYFAVDGVGRSQTDNGTADGFDGISITLNTPPTITANQSFTIDENSAEDTAIDTVAADETGLTWSITGGNLDVDGDGTNAFAIDSATGELSVNDPGDLNFESPTRNFQLSIKAADTQGFSDTETVQVQVQDVDETPEIVSFSAPASANEGSAITLTGQIFDPDRNDAQTVRIDWGDGTTAQIQSSSLVSQGGGNKTFSINHTYDDNEPNGGAYQIQVFLDEGGSEVDASAPRPISVINVAPQILPDGPVTLNSDEDTPISFTLSASDASSVDTFTWSVIAAENGTVTPETSTAESPTFTYTPNANFNGTDTFQVQVTDDDGGVDTVNVTVDVASAIDTPTAPTLSVSQSVINEGDTITLTGSFVDPDVDDTFQVSINWGDGSGTQTLVFNDTTQDLTFNAATNTYSFAVDHEYIADGDPTNISVIVQDSFGETSLSTTQITVNNEVPELLPGSTSLQIDEDTTGTITFTAEDTDDTFTWSIAASPSNGTASVSTTDTGAIQDVTYTPDANYSGFDQFVVQVADPDGGINTANVTVFVEPVNDAPTNLTLNVPATPVDEGTEVTISGSFVDVDNAIDELVDDVHTLTVDWGDGTIETFQESDLQADNTTPIFSGTDQTTVSFAGITHTYLDEGDGTYTVKVTATDAAGESVSTTKEIAVDNVDPEIVEPGTTTPIPDGTPIAESTPEDTPIELTAEAIDAGELDNLTWSIAAQPNNGSITLGPVTENGVQPFTYTPNLNYADAATPDTFTLRVTDGDGGIDEITYNITVTPENDAPEILINDFNITEGVPLEVDLSVLDAQDPDTTVNTDLDFTISGAAANAFQVEGQVDGTTFTRQDIIDGKVSFLYDQQVDPAFTITVTDAGGLTDQAAGNVEFVPVNDAPVLTLGTFTVTEGASALIDNNVISATDEETPNGQLVFTVSQVEGGTFLVRNPETNAFEASETFTQAQINAGAVRFENDDTETDPSYLITVSDGEITTVPVAGNGTVETINDPPTIDVVNFSVTEGVELPIDLTVLDASDAETVDNSQIIFTITGEDFDSFLVNGQPPADTATEVSFTRLQIIDNEVSFLYEGEDAPQFTITVSDNSDPALAETTVQSVVVDDFTPVNDLPVLTTSTDPQTPLAPGTSVFDVDENGNVLLNTTNLFATDADIANDNQLLFEVSNVEGGNFLVSGEVGTSFTLGQLRNNSVRFRNDGTAVDPSFLITVSDGTDTTDPIVLTGTLQNEVNDAPTITVNNFDFIENEPLLVDTTVLDASDEETTDDSLIQFTINNAPASEVFELKVDGAVIDPSVDPLTFNLAQVLNNQVFITYSGETAPSFQIQVNDNNSQLTNPAGDGADDTTTVLANIEFTARNDTPSFEAGLTPFTVVEGSRTTITTANIDATDADNADNTLRFDVSDVQGGNFVVAGVPNSTSFTRSQIIQGLVRFQHDGSETEPSYQITVTDGTATSEALALSGDVTPVNDPPTIDVVNFSVTEGVELPVDTTVLDASDIETIDNSQITFTITGEDFLSFQGPGVEYQDASGNLPTPPAAPTQAVFTRQDIIDGGVSFLYEGEDAPRFTITVNDNGSPTAQEAVQNVVVDDFTPVNDLPVLLSGNPPVEPASGDSIFSVDENGNVLLSATNLFATDADIANDNQLLFEVSNVEGGNFLVSGEVGTSFTLGQLRNNSVRFRNDGTAVNPSFLITVSDGTDTTDPIVLTGTLQNEVNDAPTITVNNFDFIENEPLLVDTTVLDASDEETLDDSLIEFTINNAPASEVFELKVDGTVIDPSVNPLTFNLAQVLNNQVFITYSGETAPSFQIEVNDNNSQLTNPAGDGADDTTPVLANIEFTPQNDTPSFDEGLTPFTVGEGSRVTITTANIDATDADNADNTLRFDVSDVQGGNFVVAGVPNSTSFTRSQIIQGLVRFQHDGSGVDPSYQITVSDGTATSAAETLTGNVNEVNDAPTIDTNNFTFIEGEPLLVDTTVLDASDEETTDPSLIEFTISAAPTGTFPTGAFEVSGNLQNTFTLQQILDEQVTFTYEGEETPSFLIEVSDNNSDATGPQAGDGFDDTASELANIDFTAVNDAPELTITFPNSIPEGETLTVGTDAATSDVVISGTDEETTNPANLVYTVVSDSNISFQLDGENTDTFTQAQIDAGQVTFVHDGSETPLTASLTITLSDSDPAGAETTDIAVNLDVAPENDAPQLLLNQLAVSEGATVTLDTADLNASDAETSSLNLKFNISNIQNGFFTVDGATFGVNQTNATGSFTLTQVIQEQVTFTHIDDNEVPGNPDAQLPSYDVAVQDLDVNGNPGLTSSEPAGAAADITFTAVNDAPELEDVTFTIAEDGVQLITSANVNAIDPDALPSDLQYTVTNVAGGFFARVANGETVQTDTFSQADINDPSNIVFVHDGSNTAPSYTLKVEDELGASDTANFTATLDPVNDVPTIVTNTITLIEGEEVTLTIDDLKASDEESGPSSLTFTLTEVLGGDFFTVDSGQLIAGGQFTQQEVLDGEVTFKHDGTNDAPSYTLKVTDGGIIVGGVAQDIETSAPSTVVVDFTAVNDAPTIGPEDDPAPFTFIISQGGTAAINEQIFFVEDEESTNKELLVYTAEVENGTFLVSGTATNQFTQQDIAAGRVTFEHDGSELPPSYTLTVSDSGVPTPETLVITRTLDGALFENTNDAPEIGNNTLSLSEGGTKVLSTTNLSATDLETDRLDLTFEITDIANGTFTVEDVNGNVTTFGEVTPTATPTPDPANTTSGTFTLLDVIEGRVSFTHDGFDFAPAYQVQVTDTGIPQLDADGNPVLDANGDPVLAEPPASSAVEPATIAFTRENDDPVLIDPATATFNIGEGKTKVVPLTAIDATDENGETAQSALTFFVDSVLGGFFADANNFDPADPDTAITEFTRADIAGGGVVFVHDGQNDPPSYTLTVKDTEGGEATESYTGTLTKVNDEPTWTLNQLTLVENDAGDKTFLDSNNLFAIDEESTASQLTYTVVSVNGGSFFKGDNLTGVFTQQDVLDGVISFVQNTENNNDAPTYSLSLKDSGITDSDGNVIAGSPITIAPPEPIAIGDVNFTAVNDVPTPLDENGVPLPTTDFVISVPTIQEGAQVALSNDPTSTTTIVINTDDEESLPSELVYTVDESLNGDFKLISTGEVLTSFTQAQVDAGVISYFHDDSELAPSFTLTLTDQAVGEDPANVLTQTVVPEFKLDNDAPTFTANQLAPVEGQLITLTAANLAASDREDAATQLKFSIDPATVTDGDTTIDGNKFFLNGTELTAADTFTIVDINAGLLTFQDDGDEFAPTYEVTVTDTDGAAVTETATIDLANFQVNDDPEITQNNFKFQEGEFLILNKTDNLLTVDDETTDPAQLVYTIVDPVGVTFLRNGNEPTLTFTQQEINVGAIAFQHDDETTDPSFTITVEDPDGGVTTAPASVDYEDINDPPVAIDDSGEGFTTTQNTVLLTPSLVANDTDEEGATLFVASVNGGDSNLTSGAKVTVNGNAVSYNPNGAFTDLGAGETTTDTFEYTVSDGSQTATGTVTIVIEGVNDPPVAADDDFTGTPIAENTVSVFNVLDNDGPDPDGDTLTISSVDATGATGQVTTDGSTITYDASTVQGLAAGETLEETFTYEISDGNGGTDTATVKVSVLGVEDAPVAVADSGEGFITPDDFQPFTTVPLTDNDLEDDGDPLTITKLNDAAAATGDIITLDSGGTLLLNADNSVTYTPPATFEALAAGETQDEVFTYTISDGTSESTATATITVTGVNVPPVAVDDLTPGFKTTEDKSVTLTVLANDTDADGDTLTISKVDLTGVQGKVTNNGTTLTYNPSPTFNSLKAGATATETLTYTIADGNGGTDTASVSVTITGVNDVPNAVNDSGKGFATDEDTAITLPNVLSNDTDPDGDTLTITSINTSQTEGTVTNKNGVLTYDPNGAFDLLGAGATAQDTFTYTVSDGNGGTDTATVTINITGLVEIPNSFFDLARLLQYRNLNATVPGDQIDSLPLAQLYDENFYLSQNRDVAVAIGAGRLESGYQHFVNFGIAEGRNPSILFDEEYYLANNDDVRQAVEGPNPSFASGLQHFLLFGHEEVNRNPSPFFNQQQYLANNQDVVTAINAGDFQSPFEHYIEAGSDETRVPALALYNEGYYLATNADIRNAVINGSLGSGFEHFVTFGQREGRNPSSLYDEDSYLNLNPDVANAVTAGDFISGFQHYEQIGRFEGRPVF